MSDETYQGWTNRETWCVALWLNNEQGSQEMAREIAQGASTDYEAGELILEWLDEYAPEVPGMVQDMLNCAYGRVDLRELGKAFREV